MTLDEITEIDKEVLAARYEAAITEEFGAAGTHPGHLGNS
jgi:hypothetical protein